MNFKERLHNTINQGVDISKDLFSKAKEKAKDLGEIGMIKLDIRQLEVQANKLVAELGTHVYEAFLEKEQSTLSKGSPAIKETLAELEELKRRIEEKEADLKKME